MSNAFTYERCLAVHIHEFQKLMKKIYFHRDSERGAKGTFKWLVDEVKELEEAVEMRDKKAMQNEFADVLAWLASLANVVHIDLEKAAMSKYEGACPKCKAKPCECPSFFKTT